MSAPRYTVRRSATHFMMGVSAGGLTTAWLPWAPAVKGHLWMPVGFVLPALVAWLSALRESRAEAEKRATLWRLQWVAGWVWLAIGVPSLLLLLAAGDPDTRLKTVGVGLATALVAVELQDLWARPKDLG